MKIAKNLRKNSGLLFIALPGVIFIFLLKYLPMPGILIAFKNYKIRPGSGFFTNLWNSEWVGLENFRFLFESKDINVILRNTLGYNTIFIIGGLILAVTVAIIINEMVNKKSRNIFQTFMFFPFFMSWISISFMFNGFLDKDSGILNQIITFFGGVAVDWYQDPTWWPLIIIIAGFWKTIGYNSVIYLSAIVSIDKSYYEAALIDGASKWQQIKYITVPALKPLMIILTILAIGGIMYSDFGLFYQLPKASGALLDVTNTLDIFVYNTLRVTGKVSLSAAAGFFQSMIGLILIIVTNFVVRKIDKEKSLF